MLRTTTLLLPHSFCWTRFGTEAGERIEGIFERKEAERRANGGVFFWGIGNSVAPGITELLRRCDRPEVLFSPIKGRARSVDIAPLDVVAWTAGETLAGEQFDLPPAVRVTSRANHRNSSTPHYALVCSAEEPLAMSDLGRLNFLELENLVSGRALGASQVTAVVSKAQGESTGSEYVVALRASLVSPYFVRLRNPVPAHHVGELLVA